MEGKEKNWTDGKENGNNGRKIERKQWIEKRKVE